MPDIIRFGGPVMYPLLLCSIITFTVIIERAFFWINIKRKHSRHIVEHILELCMQQKWEKVKEKTKGSEDYIVKILVSGILHRDFSMSKAMESAAEEEIRKMSKYMRILDTMITVAPLIGILGTVIGIITSFKLLGASGIEDPRGVTNGIAQALITTAAGLIISISSVFPYNFFNSKIDEAVIEIEQYATRLELLFETGSKDRYPIESKKS